MPDNLLHHPVIYRALVLTAIDELTGHIPEKSAIETAHKIARRFCKAHAEKTYRVPSLKRADRMARDAQIREQAKTMSVDQIARQYGLTHRWVFEILRETE